MTKIICETTGEFQLVDYGNKGHIIRAFRPTVTANTQFVSQRAAANQIRVLATVSDEATDEEFENYLRDSDGDVALAVESFKTTYSIEPQPTKPATTRRVK